MCGMMQEEPGENQSAPGLSPHVPFRGSRIRASAEYT